MQQPGVHSLVTLNIRVCVRCTLPVNSLACASLLCCAVSTLLTGSVYLYILDTSELEVNFCSPWSLICFGPLYSKSSEVSGETSKSVGPIGVSQSTIDSGLPPSVDTHGGSPDATGGSPTSTTGGPNALGLIEYKQVFLKRRFVLQCQRVT